MKGLLFTATLAYGGALLSLFSPFYGLLIYVCFAVLRPEDMWAYSIQGGNYSRIIALAMLAGWAWHIGLAFIAGRGVNFRLGRGKTIALLFTGFWIWTVYLATGCKYQKLGWEYVESLGKILLPFLVGITTIDSIKKLKMLAWTIIISQGYVAFHLNMQYFSGYNQLQVAGFAGLDNNSMAISLVTVIGMSGFMFLHVEKMWQKAIIAACGAFMTHAVLFSFSRGGMVALVVVGMTAFLLLKKTSRHYVAFAFASIGVIYAAGPEVRARFLRTFERTNHGKREASAQSRIDLWKDCWVVFKNDPVMGCGPNHWPTLAHRFGWERGKEAHSLWVQTATETGFPGILMLGGFYVVCVWRLLLLIRQSSDDDDPWFSDAAKMVIASIIGFGVSAQFVSLEALEVPYYVTLLGAATLTVYDKLRREQEEEFANMHDDLYDEDGVLYEDQWDEQTAMWTPAPVA